MIARYDMEDVYIFSTDYPHAEGSGEPVGKLNKWLQRLPTVYARKSYADNARLLFPDR